MTDFYKDVPKGLADNLRYRLALRKRAAKDTRFQRAMMAACKHDVLFWMAAWCWCYEPRPKVIDGAQQPKTLPMIPWAHQEPVIRTLRANLGFRDIGAEKSRGEGFSWMVVLLALHDWLFDPQSKVGLVSRTEDEADDPENSDSMFWKIDWELTKLPVWMVGDPKKDWTRNRTKHSLTNHRNRNAQINADAATGNVFRGGRLKWAGMDEFAFFPYGDDSQALASSAGATNSRLFISTVNGTDNEYYKLMHEPSNMVRIVMDWKDNPTRNRGLYRLTGGVPVAVDPKNNPLPAHYSPPSPEIIELFSRLRHKGFKLEEKLRSPWYDNECDRPRMTPQRIAQELDRDYGGSMTRFFMSDFMTKAEAEVRPPTTRGNLTYHPETLEPLFDRAIGDDGPMLLWTHLDQKLRPPPRPYVVGADVAAGGGGSYSSNSAVVVIDQITCEQVFEFAVNTTEPSDFADLCIAISKWFHDAYLVWEANGPGRTFTRRVLAKQYPNIYCRTQLWKRSKRTTKEAGWWSDGNTKEAMFGEVNRSVRSGEVKIRSADLAREHGQYVRINGRPEHVLAAKTDDQAARGSAHGDRVIAFGMAIHGLRDRPLPSRAIADYVPDNPKVNTLAHRMKLIENANQAEMDEWDSRVTADLAAGR